MAFRPKEASAFHPLFTGHNLKYISGSTGISVISMPLRPGAPHGFRATNILYRKPASQKQWRATNLGMYFSLQWTIISLACSLVRIVFNTTQHHPLKPQKVTGFGCFWQETTLAPAGCNGWANFGEVEKLKGSRRMQSGQGQLCTVSILILTRNSSQNARQKSPWSPNDLW